jgi:hypothetical protein
VYFAEVSHCPRKYLTRVSLRYNLELLSSDPTCSVLLSDTTQNSYLLILLALFSSQLQLRTTIFWSYLLCSSLRYNSEMLSSDPNCSVLLSGATQNCCLLAPLALYFSQNCYLLIILALFSSQIQLRNVVSWPLLLCFFLSDIIQNCYLLTPLTLFFSQIQIRTAVFWPQLLCSSLRYISEKLSSDPNCSVLLSGATQNCYLLTVLALFSAVWFELFSFLFFWIFIMWYYTLCFQYCCLNKMCSLSLCVCVCVCVCVKHFGPIGWNGYEREINRM